MKEVDRKVCVLGNRRPKWNGVAVKTITSIKMLFDFKLPLNLDFFFDSMV